jgi:tetratricopeptide (TPR) repeat protein
LIRQDRSDEAVAALCRAAALDPARGAVYRRLAAARILNRNAVRGIWASRIALRLDPGDAQAWASLAVARYELDGYEEAVATAKQALRLDPALVDGHATLGAAMLDLVRPAESVRSYDRLLALRPRLDSAIWNRALARLLLGDYTLGWRDFAARWHTPAFRPYRRRFDCPAWTPQMGGGGTVLVHSEQGLGDIIQMLRYVPLIVARGWRVVLELPPALHRLGARLPGVVRVLPPQARPPRVDAACALLDLPLLFGTTLATIPAVTPYLTVDPVGQAFWRLRLKALVPEGRRIGLVWRGNPDHARDRIRSMPSADLGRILGPVLALPGLHIVALQIPADPAGLESLARAAPAPGILTDLGPDLKDMSETAAIMSCLDRIVTVDTAVAHLAGALGRPGLVALPFSPDWRWLTGRDDSPWYPTLRLCRQPEPGAWEAVGRALAEALDQAPAFREGHAGAA